MKFVAVFSILGVFLGLSTAIYIKNDKEFGGKTEYRRWVWEESGNIINIPNINQKFKQAEVIEGWRIYARFPGNYSFQVWRSNGGNDYTLVGQTFYKVPAPGEYTVTANPVIHAKEGDTIGYYSINGLLGYSFGPCPKTRYIKRPDRNLVKVGARFSFSTFSPEKEWDFADFSCREYSLLALLKEDKGILRCKWETHADTYIAMHNKKELRNKSLHNCKRSCETEQEFQCKSIDYIATKSRCILSDISYDEAQKKHLLRASKDYAVYRQFCPQN